MKKKKILFVSTRSPFLNIFSGDRYRAKVIINYLSKKNNLDVLFSDYFPGSKKIKGRKIFFKRNLLDRMKKFVLCLFTLKPLQLGYFYSENVNNFLKKNHGQYKTIIFHMIRSAQYLPKNYKGKKILEMTDVISKNYDQIVKSFSVFNPLTYIYFLEKILVKKYEKFCINKFDKIILTSKKDLIEAKIKNKNKFIQILNPIKLNKNIYKFKKSNYKILFIGNINYLPNKEACKNFANEILPKINVQYPDIEFHIIGEIKYSDKMFFNKIKKTYAHGRMKKLDAVIKASICGICNMKIATGMQNKIFTYQSFGLPCISSHLSFKNSFLKKDKEVLVYNNENEFVFLIKKLKENKRFAKRISKFSYDTIKKNYNENKTLSLYQNII